MLYCDEIVPRDSGAWVRQKPGWDITRLRQSAYLGDWVWYRAETVSRLGGFDPERAGAEEYDLQLRLGETAPGQAAHRIVRLPEALFTRSAASRRDDIPADVFCARAAEAVTAHLTRSGIPAAVQNRQHLGLFHHLRMAADPGTATILLVDDATIADLNARVTPLLSDGVLTGPIILAGASLNEPMVKYLTAVTEQQCRAGGQGARRTPATGPVAQRGARRAPWRW